MGIQRYIVSDHRNLETYKALNHIMEQARSDKERKKRKARADYNNYFNKLADFINDPTVARLFIDITVSLYPERHKELIRLLVENLDPNDTSIRMYFAYKVLDIRDFDLAAQVMEDLCPGQDLCLREYVRGRIAYNGGKEDEARQHFLRVVLTDPHFMETYPFLESLDPSFGWRYLSDIAALGRGGSAKNIGDTGGGEHEDLLLACDQWFKGDWNGAIAAVRRLSSFNDGDPFTLIVFAKMSVELGSYGDAVESFDAALEILKDSEYVAMELASTYCKMGDYDSALRTIYRVKEFDPNSHRILVKEFIALIDDGRRHEANHLLGRLLSCMGLDAGDLEECLTVLRAHSMMMEATQLSKRLQSRCVDKGYGEFLLAADAYENGFHSVAISHASSAIRHNKNDVRARCLRLKARLHTDSKLRSYNEVNRMLDVYPNDTLVLDVKKDMLRNDGQYAEALEVCERILSLEPRNTDAMIDRAIILGLMRDNTNSIDAYKEALNIRQDITLFTSILRELLKQRRVSDICHLVNDFDDTFGRSVLVWRIRGNAEYLDGRYEDAIISYGNAAHLSPNDADIWHSKGLAEEAADLLEEAENSFGKAILIDLDNNDYWISKAVVQEKRGNYSGAITSINKVITSAENGVFPLALKARLLAKLGHMNESLYFLNQAQMIEPNNVGLLRLIRDALIHVKEYRKALDICKKIISLTGNDVETSADMAQIYIEIKERDKGKEILDKLCQNESLRIPVLSMCASSYHQLGCFEEESQLLERIRALEPDNHDVLLRLAESYSILQKRDLTVEIYNKLEESEPGDVDITLKKAMLDGEAGEEVAETPAEEERKPQSLMELAQISVDTGHEDDALHMYRNIIESDQDCQEAYVAAAEILLGKGEIAEVLKLTADANRMFPNDTRILKTMGDAYYSSGRKEDAVTSYTEALRLGMDTAALHNNLGHALEDTGMLKMALDNYTIAVEKEPNNLKYRLSMASLEMRVGHYDRAVQVLESILTVDHRHVEALKMYVSICCHRNDTEAVLALYHDILLAEMGKEDLAFFVSSLRELGEDKRADELENR